MLTQDIKDIINGRIIMKDGRTVDQIYKGFQIYKSGKAPAEFTAIKENDRYQGSMDDVKNKIDKYWEKKDAEEVLKKTGDEDKYKNPMKPGFKPLDPPVDPKKRDAAKKEQLKLQAEFKDALDPDETFDIRDIEKETIAGDDLPSSSQARKIKELENAININRKAGLNNLADKLQKELDQVRSEVIIRGTGDGDDKLKYGPYKGKSIKETPDDYVGHLYQNAPIGSSVYKEAEKVLKGRGIFKKWEKYSADSETIDALDPDETHDIRDIEKETISNDYFRKVLFTADRLQLVIMCLKPGEDIGEEVHPTTDQFFRIEEGKGKAVVDGKEINITDGSSILIKSGRVHNIINNSNKPLRLYSLYSPPQHRDGLIQKEK